ncbi:MAG: hypothetical protein Q7R87_02850 [Nanoarchaeota archaeon]|nr:hypothetical protein [Nanoarchaeota archaeon]
MKSFSKVTIDKWRAEFEKRRYPHRLAHLDGRSIDYFIMPSGLFDMNGLHIPNGLFRMTGDKNAGHLIGVSEEVPTAIRPHFAMSEHDEFMIHGLEDEHRTIHSEQHTLGVLGNKLRLRQLYVANKLELYDHMLKHAKGNLVKWGFTRKDYQGFESAVDFLRSK